MPKQASDITLPATTVPSDRPAVGRARLVSRVPVPIVVHAHLGVLNTTDSDYQGVDCVLQSGERMMRARSREGRWSAWLRVSVVMFVAVALVAITGCGGSSKPAYCSDRSNLENSVKGLTSAASSGDISGLKSQVTKIQSDATSLVSSAKSDFPSQTSAVKSSVAALQSAVTALPASPSAAQIAAIAKSATAVVSSVKSFSDASKSKCS